MVTDHKTAFTPSPWESVYNGAGRGFTRVFIRHIGLTPAHVPNGKYVAEIDAKIPEDRDEAIGNARLIAAAPELLAALEALVDLYYADGRDVTAYRVWDAAKAAIAKAKGS